MLASKTRPDPTYELPPGDSEPGDPRPAEEKAEGKEGGLEHGSPFRVGLGTKTRVSRVVKFER